MTTAARQNHREQRARRLLALAAAGWIRRLMMLPVELDEVIRLMRTSTNPTVDPPHPASDALIAAAERRLAVQFPESFKEFQRQFGAIGFGSQEFLGLIDENFDTNSDPCAISSTLHLRRFGALPEPFVNVYNVGEGTHYVLDTSALKRGECPVLAWRHGTYTEPAYSNYAEFVLDRVESA